MSNSDDNYKIYKLTCMKNKKVYIGATRQNVKDRWRNGKAYKTGDLAIDIEKYGWDAFDKQIVESGLSQEKAIQKEKQYIEKYDSYINGYNNSEGGEIPTNEKIEKTKKSLTGRKIGAEARKNMSEARIGMKFSDEHKMHLSESHVGNTGFWTGKKRDKKTAESISDKLSKPIRCIETGQVFKNLREASLVTGYPQSSISKWCNGVKSRYSNLTFERI